MDTDRCYEFTSGGDIYILHKNSGASGAVISVADSDLISSKLEVGDQFEVGGLRCGVIEAKLKSRKARKTMSIS